MKNKFLSVFLSLIMLVSAFSCATPYKNITAQASTDYSISGDSKIYLPSSVVSLKYTKHPYILLDSNGQACDDASFSLNKSVDGCYITSDGELRIYGATKTQLEGLKVIANYNGSSYEKEITFLDGYASDFSGVYADVGPYWASFSFKTDNGNQHIGPASAGGRTDSKFSPIAEPFGGVVTAKFSYKVEATAKNVVFSGSTISSNPTNNGQWWMYFSASKSGNTASITTKVGNDIIANAISHTMAEGDNWIDVKLEVSVVENTVKLYIDNALKVSTVLDSDYYKYRIAYFMSYADIDNVDIFSGYEISPSDMSISVETDRINIPSSGEPTTEPLVAKVTENSTVLSDHPVKWELFGTPTGATLEDSSLTVDSSAQSPVQVKATIPGTSISSDIKKIFLLRPGEENVLSVEGAHALTIPFTGSITSSYTAQSLTGESINPVWSVSPAGQGVSVSNSGTVTVLSSAIAGTYTVTATDGEKSGFATVELSSNTIELIGLSNIMLPATSGAIKLQYTVKDGEGNTLNNVEYSFDKEVKNFYISNDGVLRVFSSNMTELHGFKLKLIAKVGSVTAEKELTFTSGYKCDFSGSIWQGGSEGYEDSNRYLVAGGNRVNSDDRMSGPYDGDLTVKFKYRLDSVARTIDLAGAAKSETEWNVWWITFSARKEGNKAKINLSSAGNNVVSNLEYSIDEDDYWIDVKYVIYQDTKSIDLYIDGVKKASGRINPSLYNYAIRKIITYADIDDIEYFNGIEASVNEYELTILNDSLVRPLEGNVSETKLSASITENSVLLAQDPSFLNWELATQTDKVSVKDNKIIVQSGAPATVDVVCSVLDTPVKVTKTLNILEPDVYVEKVGNELRFTGNPSSTYTIDLYAPYDSSTTVSAFLKCGDRGLYGSTYTTHTISTNSSGQATFDLSGYAPGLYKVYVSGSVENYMEFTNKFEAVFAPADAVNNMNEEENFKSFLAIYSNLKKDEIASAYSTYKAMSPECKEAVAKIISGNINDFSVAVNIIAFISEVGESAFYPTNSSTELMQKLGQNNVPTLPFTLLAKNLTPQNVANSVLNQSYNSLDTFLEVLQEKSILLGLSKIANTDDARVFLGALGNSKYDNASYEQQSIICSAVGNNTYLSIFDVNLAVNAVNITVSTPGGSQSGPSYVGTVTGGGGGNIGTGTESPSEQPTQSRYTDVNSSHWGYAAIEELSKKKILLGSNGYFRPEDNITRAEFIKILVVSFNIETVEGQSGFSDVSKDEWYAKYIEGARLAGLVQGSDNMVNPNESIKREDAAVLVYRFAKLRGIEFENGATEFSDASIISDYAAEAVAKMNASGYIKGMGNGTFAPLSFVTRAQSAQMLYNIITGGGVK